MEKFHKYCLSVLLVIICSNISAQISNESVDNEDCKQLYELYSRILNYDCSTSPEFCIKKDSKCHLAIHSRQNAGDIIGKIFPGKPEFNLFKNKEGAVFSQKQKHQQLLMNFEKNSEESVFAPILYFKTKVSKVRNKDYLDVIG
ncbi:hypothetical protein SAMN05880574_1026 [Chryseobacterium sp. RU37D]|uniref:hypothetical protein n=1 Tax=Chryseobacterium sp. RU37D TaxID=1907397 RepID=UPI0009548282|nr:hypothetical protein [Chryseobacterium sp. RU37D]SIP89806.1 hypothetical protein SAMN05880574_1026 [Chryseobacterium sp. RU37D]